MKVKHKRLWLSYSAFSRQYYTLEKTMNKFHCNGTNAYTIHKVQYHG